MTRTRATSSHVAEPQPLLSDEDRERLLGTMDLVSETAESDLFLTRIEDVLRRYRGEPMDVRWMKERSKTLAQVATLSAHLAEELRVIGEWADEGILTLQPRYDRAAPSQEPARWWGDERADLAKRLASLSVAAEDARLDFSTPPVRTHRGDIADLVRWLLEVIVSHYHGRRRGRSAKWQSAVKEALAICLPVAGVRGGPHEERLWRDYVVPELKELRAWAAIPDK